MAFKIFHSSDWHLGKRLYKAERLDEQKLFLNWLLAEIKTQEIDLLLIAGDIFDTPFPPTEALRLYFEFLRRICDETKAQVILIAGNHDSGRFLEAPVPFLREKSIHILGQMSAKAPLDSLIKIKNAQGEEVEILALPFFRNHELEDLAKELDFEYNGENIGDLFELFFSTRLPPKRCPRLMMGHHQFGSAESEGSELTLSISGLHSIPCEPFMKYFDYVALGHIHRPTVLKDGPPVIYSGSPIPWRFSETSKKFIFALHIEHSKLSYEKQLIPVFRKLIRIELEQATWESELGEYFKNLSDESLTPFAEVHIKLNAPSHEITERVREKLKENNIELLAYHSELPETVYDGKASSSWRELHLEDLLVSHFKEKFKTDEIPADLTKSFKELLVMASKDGP